MNRGHVLPNQVLDSPLLQLSIGPTLDGPTVRQAPRFNPGDTNLDATPERLRPIDALWALAPLKLTQLKIAGRTEWAMGKCRFARNHASPFRLKVCAAPVHLWGTLLTLRARYERSQHVTGGGAFARRRRSCTLSDADASQ
jgi:hypothetical protein